MHYNWPKPLAQTIKIHYAMERHFIRRQRTWVKWVLLSVEFAIQIEQFLSFLAIASAKHEPAIPNVYKMTSNFLLFDYENCRGTDLILSDELYIIITVNNELDYTTFWQWIYRIRNLNWKKHKFLFLDNGWFLKNDITEFNIELNNITNYIFTYVPMFEFHKDPSFF